MTGKFHFGTYHADKMTPATLKTIREAIGISVPWLAAQTSVQERTVRYWESGRMAVPEDAAELILSLDKTSFKAAQQAMLLIQEHIKAAGKPTDPVVLVRYRSDEDLWKFRADMKGLPASFHGSIIARVMLLGKNAGIEIVTEWFDADAYQAWLKGTKQKDSESLRAQFVSLE